MLKMCSYTCACVQVLFQESERRVWLWCGVRGGSWRWRNLAYLRGEDRREGGESWLKFWEHENKSNGMKKRKKTLRWDWNSPARKRTTGSRKAEGVTCDRMEIALHSRSSSVKEAVIFTGHQRLDPNPHKAKKLSQMIQRVVEEHKLFHLSCLHCGRSRRAVQVCLTSLPLLLQWMGKGWGDCWRREV